MAVEARRGCGFRKVGGLYLVCDPGGLEGCGKLPVALTVCPCCGGGIKQSRGWTWVQPTALIPPGPCGTVTSRRCLTCATACPDLMGERAGLLWVGDKFYTPESFTEEAMQMGVSKRIAAVPRGFEVGKTWVLVAHPKAGRTVNEDGEEVICGGIFGVFKPTRIEKIVTESEAQDDLAMRRLEQQGITPVVVPDDDQDHVGGSNGCVDNCSLPGF